MNTKTFTPNQIRKLGLEALSKALGPVGTIRFLSYFENGKGDYTKDRKKWLGKLNIQDITKEIKQKQKNK